MEGKRERDGEIEPLPEQAAKKAQTAEAVKASDSDDDMPLALFVQKKAQVAVQPVKPKPQGAPMVGAKSTPAKAAPKAVVAVKKEAPPKPAPAPAPKKAAPAVVKKEAEDSSSDVPLAKLVTQKKQDAAESKKPKKVAETKKAAPKKATPAKKKRKDEDEEDEEEEGGGEEESSEDIPLAQLASQKKAKNSEGKSDKKGAKDEEDVWEWWNEPPLPAGKKWRTLVHNGVVFAPEYVPHGVKMLYDGKPVDLSPEAEERATHYARYLDTPHTQKDAFNKNFFAEFKELANKGRKGALITKFELCNFRPLKEFQDEEKEKRKNRSKEEKQKEKEEKKVMQEKYGFAIVDGHKQKIGNYLVEPPGLFLGRGSHPKTGMWKQRIMPENVTINIGKGAPVPPCPIAGHKWGEVVHRDGVTWLASWNESLQGGIKYVMLAASSRTKGQSDMAKFDKARKLKKEIDKIRSAYRKSWKSSDAKERQRAVVVYLIDKLALRVGGEKDTENTADTVGSCSLRVEHITLTKPNTLTLDFLGKDSMRYFNTVEIEPEVFNCLSDFVKGKSPEDDLFDEVNPSIVNEYLKEFMDGLSAKVFRTYNASITLQKELEGTPADGTVEEKVAYYNRANKQVAILCNHKRSVPPKHQESMQNLNKKLDAMEKEVTDLNAHLKRVKAGKNPLDRGKDEDGEDLPPFPTDPGKIEKQIAKLEERLAKERIKRQDKEDNAEVALGTSKINYNDPRITAAWCKKYDVPWNKVFSAALRLKFPWAQVADADWSF